MWRGFARVTAIQRKNSTVCLVASPNTLWTTALVASIWAILLSQVMCSLPPVLPSSVVLQDLQDRETQRERLCILQIKYHWPQLSCNSFPFPRIRPKWCHSKPPQVGSHVVVGNFGDVGAWFADIRVCLEAHLSMGGGGLFWSPARCSITGHVLRCPPHRPHHTFLRHAYPTFITCLKSPMTRCRTDGFPNV